MKAIAVNGSARMNGNTDRLIKEVFKELEAGDIDTEIIHIGGKMLRGCTACMKCFDTRDEKCAMDDDEINSYIQKLKQADIIILGSPTYFANVSSEMKAFIDRAGMTSRANGDIFRRKLGAAVVAVRRSGEIHAFNSMNHFFLIGQMIVVGSSYWNNGSGLGPGDVERDEEGMETMRALGRNIAWLAKKIKKEG